jgi:L-ribulose-5-phosphate 3-epimerase
MFDIPPNFSRRDFLRTSAALAAGATVLGTTTRCVADLGPVKKKKPTENSGKGRIYKAVKWGMIAGGGSVLDKFQLQKELGYDGMELVSPWDGDADEVRRASEKTGMPVHALGVSAIVARSEDS